MAAAEWVLFRLAKAFYRSEVAHSAAMKRALSSSGEYDAYRSQQFQRIIGRTARYRLPIEGAVVCDLGCGAGAITAGYVSAGAAHVYGIDIDSMAIERARHLHPDSRLTFRAASVESIPIGDGLIDTIICYDVFEHVSRPAQLLQECRRILKPGGSMLIATWGWYHPFAPHLWSALPVPWAHVFFAEKTMVRACRRVYESDWYVPTIHDLTPEGVKIADKYLDEAISTDYLNKLLIRDYRKLFDGSGLSWKIYPQAFGSRYASWTKFLLNVPWIQEFVTAYIWVVLRKRVD